MKLLHKSLRLYLVYAVAVLLIAIPVFYFAIENILTEDVDEHLAAEKIRLLTKLQQQPTAPSNRLPAIFLTDFELTPLQADLLTDTFYTIYQYDTISGETMPYRVMESKVMINNIPYKLGIKNSLIDTEDLKERIILIVGIILFLIVAGLYAISIYISKKTWKPFYKTLEKLHEFRIDKNEKIQLPPTNVSEFSDLNEAIASLANTNQQVYQSQKEFTENSSHEMQTPLAVMQGKIELLMQTNPITAEQADLIMEVEQSGKKLSKLNKTLLMLAKIDNNQFPDKESVSISETVSQLSLQYQDAIAEKQLHVTADIMDASCIIANQQMIEVLVANLLINAIRHNTRNGLIRISVANNKLIIKNSGKQEALDSSRLFQRFQKQSGLHESLGLGLALVQRVCNLYNATVCYQYADGLHVFSVDFIVQG